MLANKVHYYSQISKIYRTDNKEDKLTIPIGDCQALFLTPNELFTYINNKYPQAEISANASIFVATLYDLCCKEVIGSVVGFLDVMPVPCCEGVPPDFIGSGWMVEFFDGKELVVKTAEGRLEIKGLRNPLINPLTGWVFTHIGEPYPSIIGSSGFCKQKTGFITGNVRFAFNPDNTVTVQCVCEVFYTS